MGAPHLDVGTTTSDGVTTVVVTGEIDMSSADAFRAALLDAVRSGAERVDIDLHGVGFMGSEGVRALVDAVAAGDGDGRADAPRVRIVRPSSIALTVLRVTDLEHLVVGGD
jgi:anti-anti-sigma factor